MPAIAAVDTLVGRPLDTVLEQLSSIGRFQLVYSSDLVTPGTTVMREPPAGTPLERATQVLVPFGLGLRRIDARTYAVVRSEPAPVAARGIAPAYAAEPLESIVVTASRYSLASDLPDIRTVLTQGDVEALPRLAEDALKAVHRLPGAASNGLAGLAHIRGGEASETLVVLDGLPLYEPFHLRVLQSPVSVLDERIVAGLEAYSGGFTADYGDRMSGIVDVRSLRPDAEAYYELGLSLLHANALASHRFGDGRGQWLASFRRSNLDEIADLMQSDLGEAHYVDGFARIDYEWSPATRLSVHALAARDDFLIRNTGDTEESDAEYANSYVWATVDHDWSDSLTTRAMISSTDVGAEREAVVDDPGVRTGHVDDRRDYDVLGLKLDVVHSGERWLQRAGIDLRTLSAEYEYSSVVDYAPDSPFPNARDLARTLSPSPSGTHHAVYYTARGRLTGAVTAEFGLRWDHQSYGVDSDDQFGPRVNFAWRLDGRTRLLASWGRFQQFQGIEELQVEDGVDEFRRAQHADHAILGLERELDRDWSLRLEAYRKDYGRLRTRYETLYDPLSLAPELRWDRVAIDPSSAAAQGLELMVTRRQVGPWNGWFSYAWSRVTDRVGDRDIRRGWDQTHTVNGGLGWTDGPWQATVVAQYHTGWPVTAASLDSSSGEVVLGARDAQRYAGYGSLDARVSREWQLPVGTLSAHFEVTNALNRRNPCCTDYEILSDGNGGMTLSHEQRHWLPLIPSIGVLWKF